MRGGPISLNVNDALQNPAAAQEKDSFRTDSESNRASPINADQVRPKTAPEKGIKEEDPEIGSPAHLRQRLSKGLAKSTESKIVKHYAKKALQKKVVGEMVQAKIASNKDLRNQFDSNLARVY
jgi:Fe-S cluster assembly scaffold protein SufB